MTRPFVGFYRCDSAYLVESTAIALCRQTLKAGLRGNVIWDDKAARGKLSRSMWLKGGFLAHAEASDPHPEWQPLLLSGVWTPELSKGNAAGIVIAVNDLAPPLIAGVSAVDSVLEKLLLVFDASDPECVERCRLHWKTLNDATTSEVACTLYEHDGKNWVKHP